MTGAAQKAMMKPSIIGWGTSPWGIGVWKGSV
jgi:hypothetical protein